MPIHICVPATTANLGPGFDTLGLALNLYNEVFAEVLPGDGPSRLSLHGEGADTLPRDEQHLLLQTTRWYCSELGMPCPALQLECRNHIPLARGLGSSAATIVAGLALGAHLCGRPLDLLESATRLEGHPDNVAPALMGGLIASCSGSSGALACGFPIHPCWQVAVVIPDFRLSTADARKALPETVPYGDAVFNVTRVGILLGGLREGRADLVAQGCGDRLHQPYRARLIPGFAEALAAAREAGAAGAFLSGAGPTLAAFVDRRLGVGPAVLEAMQAALTAAGQRSRPRLLEVCPDGARLAVD